VAAGSGAARDVGVVLGDGVIEEPRDQAAAAGLATPGERRRLMSLPFIMRVVAAMTLLPMLTTRR
jgi:hypothetical protein